MTCCFLEAVDGVCREICMMTFGTDGWRLVVPFWVVTTKDLGTWIWKRRVINGKR